MFGASQTHELSGGLMVGKGSKAELSFYVVKNLFKKWKILDFFPYKVILR